MKIGKKLRDSREAKNWSQDELAFKLDTSQKTISNWESNKASPSLSQFALLEDLMEVDVLSWLAEGGIIFKQKNKNGDNAQTINKDATQLFEQFEIRLSEKDKIIEEQKNFIKTLLEKLPII